MPTVTKSFNLVFQGISISPDGSQITASVGWQDQATKDAAEQSGRGRVMPSGFSHVRITNGKVFVNNKEIGTADAQLSQNAAALCSAVQAIVNGLTASGKLVP